MTRTNLHAAQQASLPRRGTVRTLAALAGLAAVSLSAFLAGRAVGGDFEATDQSDNRSVIGIQHSGPIKVVFHVTNGATKDGVDKGLFYIRKVYDGYVAAGVDPSRLDLHAVYHGDAATHLLADDAWNREQNTTQGNPNSPLIAELARHGVSIELCNNRRLENGWSKGDVHRDVLLVSGAYHRIIDLQLRGYAYVRM